MVCFNKQMALFLFKKTNFDYRTQLISLEKLLDAGLIDRKQGKWKTNPLKDVY